MNNYRLCAVNIW